MTGGRILFLGLLVMQVSCLRYGKILGIFVLLFSTNCSSDNLLETSIKENINARGSAIIQNFTINRIYVSTTGNATAANLSFSLAEKGKYSVHTGSCQNSPPLVPMTAIDAGNITAAISATQLQHGLNQLKLCYWESVRDMLSDNLGFDLTRDDAAPTVVSTAPANNAYRVDTDTNVRITFNERVVLPADTSTAIQVSNNQGIVTGTVTFDNQTNTLTFQPTTNFGFTKNIQVDLLAGIADLAGNAITPMTVRFATRFSIQWGTLGSDMAFDLAIDNANNLYLAGTAQGSLFGQPYQTSARDAFYIKYDPQGQPVFARMIGSTNTAGTGDDSFQSILVDNAGNILVTGESFGSSSFSFDGIPKIGSNDIILLRYSSDGTKLSTELIGATSNDSGRVLLRNTANEIYLVGLATSSAMLIDGQPFLGSNDIILRKYDATGVKIFTRVIGTSASESISGAALDSTGNVYITGGTLGGSFYGTNPDTNSDMYLLKYDSNGNMIWHRQVNNPGTERDAKLLIDGSNNVWQCGYATQGYDNNSTLGSTDVVLTKYNANGDKLFSRQYGTERNDYCGSIARDSLGNIFISGSTSGNFGGPNADLTGTSSDIFLMRVDANGNMVWVKQFGGAAADEALVMKINSLDQIFVAGRTQSNLEGNTLLSASNFDFFLMKFDTNGNLY
ncbi:MAG TPA: SBBP repeat-containing protein [Turneriella sp.]|nr:SBBP repeat-containing protein [Turneriella sp.]